MCTPFGWKWRPTPYCRSTGNADWPSLRSISNYMCQASAGDMLRLAAVQVFNAGIELVGTFHDALAICASFAQLDEHIAITRHCMTEAARLITGFEIGIDTQIIRWPDRYFENGKSRETWDRRMQLLDELVPE
jgi:DNA polymerase I